MSEENLDDDEKIAKLFQRTDMLLDLIEKADKVLRLHNDVITKMTREIDNLKENFNGK